MLMLEQLMLELLMLEQHINSESAKPFVLVAIILRFRQICKYQKEISPPWYHGTIISVNEF